MSLNFLNFNFKLLKFFYSFLLKDYDQFIKNNLIVFNNSISIKSKYYFSLFFYNYKIFDYVINVYKFKNLYKTSFSLNKASIYLNTYLSTYVL